nr:type II toxin-antitoxin system VapC family toxin [Variovorax boronicumulans]
MAALPLRWLLDTSIVSELARPQPALAVMQAFAMHADAGAIPMVVWHELLFGVLRLPDGQRKQSLTRFVHAVPGALPKLAYDEPVARRHAELRAVQQTRGRPLAEPDAQIAATALAHGLTLVTRNARDFHGIDGLQLANWFDG